MSKKNYTFDTVVRCGGQTFLLATQNSRTLSPLSQRVKDQRYPSIDLLSDYQIADEYGCDIIKLKAEKTAHKYKKCFDRSSPKERHHAIRTLCTLMSYTADPHCGYSCLMIALLGRVLPFLPHSFIARTPSVFCGSLLQVPPFLQLLLSAVNGPDLVHGKHFSLCRPSCLEAQKPFPRSAAVSHTPHDYIGGTLRNYNKDYRFWIPLWSRAVCIAPSLPPDVQRAILDASFSVIPFYCNSSKGTSVWDIHFPDDSLLVEDPSALEAMENYIPLLAAILDKFFRKCGDTSEKVQSFFEDMDKVIPSVHINKSIVGTLSAEGRVLAAGLCVYRAFLSYVRNKEWINSSEYYEFLTAAQDALFPTEEMTSSPESTAIGDWDTLSAFWPFLKQFLQEHKEHISVGTPCSTDTVAAVHTLRTEGDPLLIIPRNLVERSYHTYCANHGLFNDWTGADLSIASIGWSINVKKFDRDRDPAWSYHFYRPEDPAAKKDKIICLGIPINNLPTEIRKILPTV